MYKSTKKFNNRIIHPTSKKRISVRILFTIAISDFLLNTNWNFTIMPLKYVSGSRAKFRTVNIDVQVIITGIYQMWHTISLSFRVSFIMKYKGDSTNGKIFHGGDADTRPLDLE